MPIPDEQRASLQALRLALLDLHKSLLDLEREHYEKENGQIGSPGEFLSLVIGHPQFDWLRKLSGLIVEMDELISPGAKLGPEEGASAAEASRRLLDLNENGDDYQRRYWNAVQESPDVVIAHCRAERLLVRGLGACN